MTKDTIGNIGLCLVLTAILTLLIFACGSEGSIAVVKHYGCTVEGTQLICADGTGLDLSTLQGSNGADGINGQNGQDGYNSLIEVTDVCCKSKTSYKPLYCIYDPCKKTGYLIETGLDLNRDFILQDSEVMNSTVICED
jgi:hypothetical protein